MEELTDKQIEDFLPQLGYFMAQSKVTTYLTHKGEEYENRT
jgi:hypothetical protein